MIVGDIVIIKSSFADLANDVKDTYDYYTGKKSTKYTFNKEATEDDLNKTLFKPYINRFKYTALKDYRRGIVQVSFDARKAPMELSDKINPYELNSDSLYKYITGYDNHIVTMEFPMNVTESVMTPTPVPYKGLYCDKDGHTVLDDDHFISEGYSKDVLEMALDHFEDGVDFSDEDFDNPVASEMYFKLIKMKPQRFYDEYKDQLDFSPSFIRKYDNRRKRSYEYAEESASRLKERYEVVDHKDVEDSDGFITDYTWYKDNKGNNIFIFGDRDLYSPDDTSPDFETESDTEAKKWFDSYDTDEDEDDPIGIDYDEDESVSHDDSVDDEELSETYGLELSDPEVSGDQLDIEINGKPYKYRPLGDTTAEQIAKALKKIKAYSDGKALAYLKKNMQLVKESTESKPKVSFKDSHICKGCGKPLSQCTCSTDGKEDVDFESLTEADTPTQQSISFDDFLSKCDIDSNFTKRLLSGIKKVFPDYYNTMASKSYTFDDIAKVLNSLGVKMPDDVYKTDQPTNKETTTSAPTTECIDAGGATQASSIGQHKINPTKSEEDKLDEEKEDLDNLPSYVADGEGFNKWYETYENASNGDKEKMWNKLTPIQKKQVNAYSAMLAHGVDD